MSISNPELKKLYALSAGRCNICNTNLFENDVHIGQMAHIIAKSIKGPRGEEYLNSGINSYNNLILLCANHHLEVDGSLDFYTVDKLHSIKKSHESKIKHALNFSETETRERKNDVTFLNCYFEFVPFSKLPYYVQHIPGTVNFDLCRFGDMFDAILQDLPMYYPLNDTDLNRRFQNFIDAYDSLWSVIRGSSYFEGYEYSHFGEVDQSNFIRLEKNTLPYRLIQQLIVTLESRNRELLGSYHELIAFIRLNYREVNMG